MTAKQAHDSGICIQCKQPPLFYSDAGRREYAITGICEKCFDEMMTVPEEKE